MRNFAPTYADQMDGASKPVPIELHVS
jgi:hypothetical protein